MTSCVLCMCQTSKLQCRPTLAVGRRYLSSTSCLTCKNYIASRFHVGKCSDILIAGARLLTRVAFSMRSNFQPYSNKLRGLQGQAQLQPSIVVRSSSTFFFSSSSSFRRLNWKHIRMTLHQSQAILRLPFSQSLRIRKATRLHHIAAGKGTAFTCTLTTSSLQSNTTSSYLQQISAPPFKTFPTAQTYLSPTASRAAIHFLKQARVRNNIGSFLTLRKNFHTSIPQPLKSLLPPFSNFYLCQSTSARSATMSTLSQPQTPAAMDSPLREHRYNPVERLTDRLEAPSLDDRKYRVVRLPNQLEVLLVHDGETDKASAAMDVNVGNFSDDKELSGTAHAVEHLLFMGTKKVN